MIIKDRSRQTRGEHLSACDQPMPMQSNTQLEHDAYVSSIDSITNVPFGQNATGWRVGVVRSWNLGSRECVTVVKLVDPFTCPIRFSVSMAKAVKITDQWRIRVFYLLHVE